MLAALLDWPTAINLLVFVLLAYRLLERAAWTLTPSSRARLLMPAAAVMAA